MNSDKNDAAVLKVVSSIINQLLKIVMKGSAVKFKCEKCDYCARDHCNLIRHIETMHTDIEIKCLVCQQG